MSWLHIASRQTKSGQYYYIHKKKTLNSNELFSFEIYQESLLCAVDSSRCERPCLQLTLLFCFSEGEELSGFNGWCWCSHPALLAMVLPAKSRQRDCFNADLLDLGVLAALGKNYHTLKSGQEHQHTLDNKSFTRNFSSQTRVTHLSQYPAFLIL